MNYINYKKIILNMAPTILDIPSEVLFYIFTLVYGDIKKNPFFRYHERHGGRLYPRTNYKQTFYSSDLRQHVDMTYIDPNFDSRIEPMILPTTISSLCLVSRDFNNISNNLWEPFYVRHIRKDKPYKRTHPPSFYREKVYKIMKKYYENVCKLLEGPVRYHKTMEIIKNNNASRYMEYLKNIINSDGIDNENKYYRVDGLLKYDPCENDIPAVDVYLDMKIEHMINYRRRAIKEATMYSEKHDIEKKKYDDKKKIADLL